MVDYLIVGVGNTLREDDGAGVALAGHLHAELTQRGVRTHVLLVPQMLPELAAEIAELAPAILLITDCAAGDDLARLEPLLPAQTFAAGSHGLAAAQLLALAVRLYEFGGSAWMATVPGFNFAHGDGLSAGATQAIDGCLPWMVAQLLAISPVQGT